MRLINLKNVIVGVTMMALKSSFPYCQRKCVYSSYRKGLFKTTELNIWINFIFFKIVHAVQFGK